MVKMELLLRHFLLLNHGLDYVIYILPLFVVEYSIFYANYGYLLFMNPEYSVYANYRFSGFMTVMNIQYKCLL